MKKSTNHPPIGVRINQARAEQQERDDAPAPVVGPSDCPTCRGTGEGRADGLSCATCRGRGFFGIL